MMIREERRHQPLFLLWRSCIVLCVSVLPSLSFGARFLQFQVTSGAQGTEVVAGGKALLRLRSGMTVNGGAAGIANELNRLAMEGLKPTDLTIRSTDAGVEILARGTRLMLISDATARAAGATPAALAQSWLTNLKEALAVPYIVLAPASRMQVPLGETRALRWGGTAAVDLSFAAANPTVVDVQLHSDGRSLVVRGLSPGSTVLTASMSDESVQLAIDVKAWAARVPALAVAEVTSPPLPADDLRRTLRNAVLNATQPAPGATIELTEPRRSGSRYIMPLRARGPGCFDVDAQVPVELNVVSKPATKVQQLLVSNLPEKITEPATLLRERFLGGAPVRLLWHHVNRSPQPLRFSIRVANLGTEPARVHVTESASGPHHDEIFVGHQAMMRFLALTGQGEGYMLDVPAGRMLELYDVRLPVDAIVSGLAHITPVSGDGLLLEVLAENTWPTCAYFPLVPERLRNDPPLTPYRFEAEKEVALEYENGGAWAFYSIGKEYSTNLQGQKLYGDYGVRYTIGMTCRNSTTEPGKCVVSLRAGGGVARVSYFLHGKLQETGLLRAGHETIIERLELQPGEQRQLKLITVPESGSNLPITLTIRNM